ncbi:MAG: MBL fold metallo-hydrolase, partial [Solirubrobacteraceae bacterium]
RGRDTPIAVYGPPGLRALFDVFKPLIGRLPFDLRLEELEPNAALRRDGYALAAFAVDHGVRAQGYVLVEDDRPGRFDEARARARRRGGPGLRAPAARGAGGREGGRGDPGSGARPAPAWPEGGAHRRHGAL